MRDLRVIKDGATRRVRRKRGSDRYEVEGRSWVFVDGPHTIDRVDKFEGYTGCWKLDHWDLDTVQLLPRWWERLAFWRRPALPQLPKATVVR